MPESGGNEPETPLTLTTQKRVKPVANMGEKSERDHETDIAEWLRLFAHYGTVIRDDHVPKLNEAADEIERLRAALKQAQRNCGLLADA